MNTISFKREIAGDLDRAIEATTGVPKISEWSVQELRAQLGACEMVDVRGIDEWNSPLSYIEGATLVTLGEDLDRFLAEKSKLPQGHPMVFICKSGARSMRSAEQAQRLGINQAINLRGGMIAWNEAQFPTHAKKSERSPS